MMTGALVIASGLVLLLVLAAWHVHGLFRRPDYGALPPHYPFKSAAAARRYQAYYDARAKGWPAPSEARYIDTPYGRTFVTIFGPEQAPPLVLLPSGFASSLIWLPNAPDLARHFRVYATDNIYDVGRSVNTRPVVDANDLTDWLDSVLPALGLEQNVHLMGLSFGGWLASQYALCHPERLRGLVLAAPVATVFPLPAAWAWRGILGALPPQRLFMRYFLVNWMCQSLARRGDDFGRRMLDAWVKDALMAMKCFRFRMPLTPTVLTDEELRSLEMPTLFLVGEQEVIYSAERAVQRIRAVAPAIRTVVVPDASHDLTIAQHETISATVTSFLLGTAGDESKVR